MYTTQIPNQHIPVLSTPSFFNRCKNFVFRIVGYVFATKIRIQQSSTSDSKINDTDRHKQRLGSNAEGNAFYSMFHNAEVFNQAYGHGDNPVIS